VLPALIRKMHLGKLLMEDDMNAVRVDVEHRPMRGFSASQDDKQLIHALEEFGVFKTGQEVEIKLWGSGTPRREFLHSDDLAEAVVFVMQNISFKDVVKERGLKEVRNTHINIGSGVDLSIADLAGMVKKITGFKGKISWDADKPDGTYRKLMDVSRLRDLGWQATIQLEDGIRKVYRAY